MMHTFLYIVSLNNIKTPLKKYSSDLKGILSRFRELVNSHRTFLFGTKKKQKKKRNRGKVPGTRKVAASLHSHILIGFIES